MRKSPNVLNQSAPRARRSRAPLAIFLSLGLLVSPLLYEGGQVLVARWMTMAGKYHEVRTPVFDAISEWARTANLETRQYTGRVFTGGALRPSTAVPFAIVWAVLMTVVFLRRVH